MKRIFSLFLFISAGLIYCQSAEIKDFKLNSVSPSPNRKGISWSPKGEKAKFTPQCLEQLYKNNKEFLSTLIDPVYGIIYAGDSSLNKICFALSKTSKESSYREKLIIDSDNNGMFDKDKEVFTSEAKDVRGKMWVSHSNIPLLIKFKNESVAHLINIWHVYPKPGEEGEFDVIRYSRITWMEGKTGYEGKNYRVALIDADNTLSFSGEDVWVIVEENEKADLEISKSFGVKPNKPSFIGSQAFRLVNYNDAGTMASIRKTDDVKEAAVKKEEVIREKSSKTLNWLHKLDEGFKTAKSAKKKIFVKWWADWCGPCKELEKTTLTDKIIVDMLGKDWITVSIDHDKEYLSAQEQKVKALPTIQFFDRDGKEIRRFVGFLSAEELEKMLKEIK